MAGLGFKDFAVGEVLTSADVDGYLMQQTVMRFADSAARGSALGTATGTAVPLAEGMVSYLDDVNQVEVYSGSGWSPVGPFRQMITANKTDTFSTNSTSLVDVTDLSVTITPSTATSRILVIAHVTMAATNDGYGYFIRLTGGNLAYVGDAAGNRTQASAGFIRLDTGETNPSTVVTVDSPATTSATTYKVQARVGNALGTLWINKSVTDTDVATVGRYASSITVIEVS